MISKDFMFAKLSSNYYHGIIICHPLSQWTRQIVSQKTLFTIGILYQPPLLASQSAPLMNTCWPVLRTCNSNTFVLFWASCIQKKNFYNPKITPLQIMFSKRFFLLLRREKNLCKLHSYFLHNQTKQECFLSSGSQALLQSSLWNKKR